MFGIKLPMAKSRKASPVTVVVTRCRATNPLVAIPAMPLILVPRWRSRCVVGVIPHRAYPYLCILFLRSEPVLSTNTNISGRNINPFMGGVYNYIIPTGQVVTLNNYQYSSTMLQWLYCQSTFHSMLVVGLASCLWLVRGSPYLCMASGHEPSY